MCTIKLTKHQLIDSIKENTDRLLIMAKDCCWNNNSSNVAYFSSEIVLDYVHEKSNKVHSLEQIAEYLYSFCNNLYDVNLHVYRSSQKQTIVEIKYLLKSSITIPSPDLPMFHCKIEIPIYAQNCKFDINWKRGGLRHYLNQSCFNTFFNFGRLSKY